MAEPYTISKRGNMMSLDLDDGTTIEFAPVGYGVWLSQSSGDSIDPPDPGEDGFKFPFPREQHTTYDGHSGIDWPGGVVGNTALVKAVGPGRVSAHYDTNYNTTSMGPVSGTREPIWRGICVVIDHGMIGGQRIYSLYAHLRSRSVSTGDTVAGGDDIGVVGNTGYSFGAHLHFEVDINGVRRPTGSVPSGGEVTLAWMDANASGSW